MCSPSGAYDRKKVIVYDREPWQQTRLAEKYFDVRKQLDALQRDHGHKGGYVIAREKGIFPDDWNYLSAIVIKSIDGDVTARQLLVTAEKGWLPATTTYHRWDAIARKRKGEGKTKAKAVSRARPVFQDRNWIPRLDSNICMLTVLNDVLAASSVPDDPGHAGIVEVHRLLEETRRTAVASIRHLNQAIRRDRNES